MDIGKLVHIIKNNEIGIYGAGYAAQNFYKALQIRNMDKHVKCFIVTDPEKAYGKLEGVLIKTVEDIVREKNIYICIAVHEAIKNEIEDCLLKCGLHNYVWVHPYIMELALGSPLEYHKQIEVRKILQQHCYDNYAFAIRYLAIENYYNKNNMGYDVYLKALNLQCETKTAVNRLQNFIRLIDDWDKNGYRQEQDILIDENNRLVDGTHRLSLACYHEMIHIYCTIFPYSDNYNKVVKESHFLSLDALRQSDFEQNELDALEKVRKRLLEL